MNDVRMRTSRRFRQQYSMIFAIMGSPACWRPSGSARSLDVLEIAAGQHLEAVVGIALLLAALNPIAFTHRAVVDVELRPAVTTRSGNLDERAHRRAEIDECASV